MGALLVLGAGQIGTFAARAAVEHGARVVAADLHPAAAFFTRFGPQDGTDLVEADILEQSSLRSLIERYAVDRIILAAGMTSEAGARDPERFWKMHVEGARAVGQAALRTGVERVVFVSSLAIYGRLEAGRLAETTPARPQTEYGRAKAAAEEALQQCRAEGLDVRILRSCGVYGPCRPGAGSRSARWIDSLLAHCLSRERFAIRGPAGGTDEYLYVKDLGRALALAACGEIRSEDVVFNVGTGCTTTLAELGRVLRRAVPTARFTLCMEEGKAGAGAPLQIDRIRTALGFEPRYGLAEGLSDYLLETEVLR